MLPNTFIERTHSRYWLFFLHREVATFSSDVSNASPSPAPDSAPEASDFIRKAIREDLTGGRFERVQTRWPPEPNEQISEYRGVPTRPGRESPDRERPPAESLDLLRRMRAGEFADGAYVLRARIDMASPNLNLRDPVMYRIRRVRHYRTGDAWCIYPMYDWAHGQSDSIEGVTHSLCSLEFENNRPLYDWYLDKLGIFHSRQIEFNHLNVGYAVLHKRILRRLVADGTVHGWDDPRLLTLRGMRRRGYTPSAIRAFVRSVGLTKTTVLISYAQLEYYLREELNRTATRVMAVLDPLRVVITNYPEGHSEQVEVENNPEAADAGTRPLPFSRELYIERSDFMEQAPRKFFRLSPGREVRLKGAYYITCDEAVKDGDGRVTELRCSYDHASRSCATATSWPTTATPAPARRCSTARWACATPGPSCSAPPATEPDRAFTLPPVSGVVSSQLVSAAAVPGNAGSSRGLRAGSTPPPTPPASRASP